MEGEPEPDFAGIPKKFFPIGTFVEGIKNDEVLLLRSGFDKPHW